MKAFEKLMSLITNQQHIIKSNIYLSHFLSTEQKYSKIKDGLLGFQGEKFRRIC